MPLKKPPFAYSSNLIGNEVIYRSLKQQKKLHGEGLYQMTWDQNDIDAQIDAKFQSTLLKTFYKIPDGVRGCEVDPPCPWPKEGDADADHLSEENFMPIIVSKEGVHTYRFRVTECIYHPNNTIEVGDEIGRYSDDQSKLDPSVRGDFNYSDFNLTGKATPNAMFVIEKSERGQVVNTFTYLFTFVY